MTDLPSMRDALILVALLKTYPDLEFDDVLKITQWERPRLNRAVDAYLETMAQKEEKASASG